MYPTCFMLLEGQLNSIPFINNFYATPKNLTIPAVIIIISYILCTECDDEEEAMEDGEETSIAENESMNTTDQSIIQQSSTPQGEQLFLNSTSR